MFAFVGRAVLDIAQETGSISLFFARFLRQFNLFSFYFKQFMKQCEQVGFNSVPIVVLTAFFTGGVLALQSFHGFDNATIAASQLGPVVALSMIRELGPVLASLMVAGRVGAAMAAEIGTMKVTEQIDALITLSTNPVKYLVVPRVIACLVMMPLLVTIANVVGILGGYMVATQILHLNASTYLENSFNPVGGDDLVLSLTKAAVFGVIIGVMSCYHGFNTNGGAEGVGRATTVAVVYSSVAILVADYFITAWMM